MNCVQFLSAEGIHEAPKAYSQVISKLGNVKSLYVGGQNASDASGHLVCERDLDAQVRQIIGKIETTVSSEGGSIEHLVKGKVYVLEGSKIEPLCDAFERWWGNRPNPPVITILVVSALSSPDYLVEMDFLAIVPA